ncbi:tyrosine-type recombinase/integrase [Flagellimonas sp.]|uniref:tyrosine-type recombinase/integrase n=1 Tax=Flagellimonas sp. TaxID=2058762 RepID=UPI003BA88E60
MRAVQRSKGTIRFTFKESMANLKKEPKKESLIMLHFNYGRGQRFKYSTGYYSCFSDWDLKKQRMRNKAHLLNGGHVNDYLNMLETELYKEISALDAKGLSITNVHLRQKLDQITGKSQTKDIDEPIRLFQYMDKFLDHKKGKIADVTLRSYKQTKKLLERFNSNLDFDSIDLKFYDDFVLFLEEDDKSLNTIGKHIKNLKVFLRSATQDGINKNMVFTRSDFKAPKEQTTAIYLDDEELTKLANHDLSAFPNLDKARDIFIIGCYTGQRVSDYNGLTKKNMVVRNGIPFFQIKQKKTKKEVLCPITTEIQQILNKPKNNGEPPRKMNEQDINECIKKAGKKAGITEMITHTRTKGGKEIIESTPKYDLIGTHTARRSFCTNMYKRGMPTYDIMQFSGHSTEREFYKYIRIEKEQRAVNIAKSGYFNIT